MRIKKKNRLDGYSNYYYKISKKKDRKIRFLTIIFVMFSLFIVGFFSISFSNFLEISKIVNINSNHIVTDKILYAISLDSSDNITEAKTKAETIKQQGGAGYVYNNGLNNYKILSSVYALKKDAESVKNNLAENNITAEIIEIKLNSINIKINLSNNSREVLNKGLNLFYENYLKLYNLSIEFDKQNIDILKLKTNINELYNENEKIKTEFDNIFNKSSNVYVLYVKIYLNRINEILQNLKNCEESQNISSLIKNSYCEILMQYKSLEKEMI